MTTTCSPSRLLAIAGAALAVMLPASAMAQADICPAGSSVAVLRTSKLVAGGTMDSVRKAVGLHQKWYVDHGYAADRILLEPVMQYDPAAGRIGVAGDQFVTLHLHATDVPLAQHDTGWAAFVAAYDANSKVTSTVVTCLP